MKKAIEFTQRGILLPPEIHNDLTRREFLVAAGLIALVPGCGSGGESDTEEASGETRTVEHALGTTEVPVNVERIAVLWVSTVSALASLGVDFVAAPSRDALIRGVNIPEGYDLSGVAEIGQSKAPNLERIAAAEPDVILATDFFEDIYDQLSEIAPTVAFEWGGTGAWKEHVEEVARTLGREDEGREVVADYEEHVEEAREAIGDVEDIEVSLARLQSSSVEVRMEVLNSFPGQILADVGLSRPDSQDVVEEDSGYVAISPEKLTQIDADELFVLRYETEEDRGYFEEVKSNALWGELDAVEEGDVHVVDYDVWGGSNYIAAHGVLDDLAEILGE